MDWLTFVAALVKATAWPAVVLATMLIFRRPILRVVPLITKFKWKDFEFEFGKQIAEAQAEASATLPALQQYKVWSAETHLTQLAKTAPRAAVLETWIRVDSAARGAIVRHELPQPVQPYVSTTKVLTVLQAAGLLGPEQAAIIHELRGLRNQAAHAPEFALSTEAALNYIELANRVAAHLESV